MKIARWSDINYWALKQTTEKTHRTLHKFIKQFQVDEFLFVPYMYIVRLRAVTRMVDVLNFRTLYPIFFRLNFPSYAGISLSN